MEEELKEIKEIALNNSKELKEHAKKIDTNFERIQYNSMALEILKEYKEEIKQLHAEKERQHDIIRKLYRVILLLITCIIVLGLHHLIGIR
jgi:leucyl-tRNA synthetase